MLLPSITLPTETATTKPALPKRKLLKHLSGNDYCLEIDNSTLELLMNCDRRFEYAHVFGRIANVSGSALVYGSAIHSAMEKLYRDDCRNPEELYKVVAPHFEETPPVEGEWRTLEVCLDAVQKYLKHYPSEQFNVLRPAADEHHNFPDNTPMVEVPFAIPLTVIPVNAELKYTYEQLVVPPEKPGLFDMWNECNFVVVDNLHIVWTGKIDLIAEQDGRLGIVDHKTSSVVGDSYFKGFELSQQFMGYWWSAEKLLGRELSWALVNCIAGRKPTKSGTSLEFLRRYYYYRRDQIDDWPTSIIAKCEDLVHRLIEGFFPMLTTHCTNKFGLCPFHQVCTQEPKHRQLILNSNAYTDATWSPLN